MIRFDTIQNRFDDIIPDDVEFKSSNDIENQFKRVPIHLKNSEKSSLSSQTFQTQICSSETHPSSMLALPDNFQSSKVRWCGNRPSKFQCRKPMTRRTKATTKAIMSKQPPRLYCALRVQDFHKLGQGLGQAWTRSARTGVHGNCRWEPGARRRCMFDRSMQCSARFRSWRHAWDKKQAVWRLSTRDSKKW